MVIRFRTRKIFLFVSCLFALIIVAHLVFHLWGKFEKKKMEGRTIRDLLLGLQNGSSAEEQYEKLLVDPNCYQQIALNKPCRKPIRMVSLYGISSNEQFSFDYKLEMPEDSDYLILNGPVKRLLPKIATIFKEIQVDDEDDIVVSFPVDVMQFLRYFRDSRFIESKKMAISRNETEQYLSLEKTQKILHGVRQAFQMFSNKFKKPMTAFLAGGTLLGWYRDNTIIPHTTDVDFQVKWEDLMECSSEFIKMFESTFQMRDRIGFANDSLELRFSMLKIDVDLFVLYQDFNDPQKRDYTPGIDFSKNQQLRWYIPHVNEICASSLLHSLVYVPCNVEEVLSASYGNWQKTESSKNYVDFRKLPNTVHYRNYTREEMKNVVKYPDPVAQLLNSAS